MKREEDVNEALCRAANYGSPMRDRALYEFNISIAMLVDILGEIRDELKEGKDGQRRVL